MGAIHPKQQTQLLPSRHAASRPSLRGLLTWLAPVVCLRQFASQGRAQTFALVTIAFVFLFGIIYFLHPFTIDSANAGSKNTDISLKIGESIMVPEVSSDTINITLDPTASGGDFKTASVDVNVSTNRTSGYTLTMSTEGEDTDLTNTTYSDYTIEPLSSTTSLTNFSDLSHTASMNKWGYATDNNGEAEGQTSAGYYYAMSNVNSPATIKITDGPAATSSTTVTFATKGKDLAAGEYQNTVMFTAVGNAIPEPKTYMQDMDTTACKALDEFDATDSTTIANTTYPVYDSRDENEYYIRRLADGNCWMVQNLRLVGPLTLSSTDTDLASGTFNLEAPATWKSTTVTEQHHVSATTAPVGAEANDPITSDAAYARGTYYSWQTAVLNLSTIGKSSAQTNSICPKGWDLPTYSGTLSFQTLYTNYSSDYANTMKAFDYYYSTNAGVNYYLAGYWITNGYVYNSGTWGSWWSSTSHSSNANIAWGMVAFTSSISLQNNWFRYFGLTVRCVLAGS